MDFYSKGGALDSEENTNKSIPQNNSKVVFIKRTNTKNSKKIGKDKIKNVGSNENVDVKTSLVEVCCSDNINEKCFIF